MKTESLDFVVKTYEQTWLPLIESGVLYEGVFVKSLRYDPLSERSPTILLKFNPGASYPYHNHPRGEEIYVLEGACSIAGMNLFAGDYLYTPPEYKHGVTSTYGCVLLLFIPAEVELI